MGDSLNINFYSPSPSSPPVEGGEILFDKLRVTFPLPLRERVRVRGDFKSVIV